MCLQDVAIGMATWTSSRQVTVGASLVNVAAANPLRTLLIFPPPSSLTVWISPDKNTGAGFGLGITGGMSPVILDVQKHGSLPSKEWNAVAIGGTATITVIEGQLDLERLEEFLRKLKVR